MPKNKKLVITILFILFSLCCVFTVNLFAGKEADDLFVAEKAFEDQFYEISSSLLERFAADYPQSEFIPQAKLLTAKCLFYKQKYLKALTILEELLDRADSAPIKDEVLYWMAEVHFKGKDYSQAEDYYQRLIQQFQKSSYAPFAYYSLGLAFFEEGKFNKAKEAFLGLKNDFPQSTLIEDADFKIALCFYHLKEYIKAEEEFNLYIENYPQSEVLADALFYKAECLYYREDFKQARDGYLACINNSADDNLVDLAYVGLGWAYIKLEQYLQAEDIFNNVKAKKGKVYASTLLGTAQIFRERKAFESAVETYNKFIDNFSQHEFILYAFFGKAESLYSLLKYKEAIVVYKGILGYLEGNNDKADFFELMDKVYYNLAWAYLKTGDFSNAISGFQAVADSSDDRVVKVNALVQVAGTYHDLGEYQNAIETYDAILKDYPESIYSDYVQYRSSRCLLKMGRFENAILGFRSIKINFPDSKFNDEAGYYIGVAYFQKQDFESAKDQLESFASLYPDSLLRPQGLYLKAASLFNSGLYKQAIAVFTQLIKEYPQDLDLVVKYEFEIASCFYQQGEINTAIKKFKKLLSRYPRSEIVPEVIYFLGEHYLDVDKQEMAIGYFKRLIDDYSDSDQVFDAFYSLGWIYSSQGKYDKALGQFNNILEAPGVQLKGQAILAIGDIYFEQNKFDQAQERYESVLAAYQDFSKEAYIRIANVYREFKDLNKTIESYRYALDRSAKDDLAYIQFKIAETFEEAGRIDESIEEYLKNTYFYPEDKYWLLRSYLRLARIFEDREDWPQAESIYIKIAAMDVEEAKFAQERLDWIGTILNIE